MPLTPLTEDELNKRLQVGMVDVGNGTLFSAVNKRDPNENTLTLVISTGGSGLSAITEALHTARQKIKSEFSNFVKFIVVDSDVRAIDAANNLGVDSLYISAPNMKDRFDYTHRNQFSRYILPAGFDSGEMDTFGASQKRMIGKIKFLDQTPDGASYNDGALREKIRVLFETDWAPYAEKPVDIIILAGLSGGNGSGTFLDIAAQARRAIPAGIDSRVFGYFMLPDAVNPAAALNDKDRVSLQRNGFAALMELESYMSMCFEPEREALFTSQNNAFNTPVKNATPLYNYPVLLSGSYAGAVSTIAETIINSIARSDAQFDMNSFYSNNPVKRDNELFAHVVSDDGILKVDACPEDSHLYCGIGYAKASVPERIVIPNIVSRVSRKLFTESQAMNPGQPPIPAFCTANKRLNRPDFEKAMKDLLGLKKNETLDRNSLKKKVEGYMRSRAALQDNPKDVSFNGLVNGEDITPYQRGFNAKRIVVNAQEKVAGDIRTLYKAFFDNAKVVIKQYGPRAMEFLYLGIGNVDRNAVNGDKKGTPEDFSEFCLRAQLEQVSLYFNSTAVSRGRHPGTIPGRSILDVFGRNRDVNDWKQRERDATQTDVLAETAQYMTGANGIWAVEFQRKVEEFKDYCIRFANVLENMSDFYTGVGRSLDQDEFVQFSQSVTDPNGVNLCNDDKSYQWIRGQIIGTVNGTNLIDAKNELVDDFFDNTEEWVSAELGKARKRYDDVMSRICKIGSHAEATGGLKLTINDYFTEILKGVPENMATDKINQVVSGICTRLTTASRPSIHVPANKMTHINKTVLVQASLLKGQNGPAIKAALERSSGGVVHPSDLVEGIVCYQTAVAIALSDVTDLTLWENSYKRALDITTHTNNGEYTKLHMRTGLPQYGEFTKRETDSELGVQLAGNLTPEEDETYGTGLAWKHYPSVNLHRYMNDFESTEDTEEAEYRRGAFSRKIEAALKLGIIERVQKGTNYTYWLNLIPGDWKNLSVDYYNETDKDGFLLRGKPLVDFLKSQNDKSTSHCRKQIVLYGSPFFGPDGFDFSQSMVARNWSEEKKEEVRMSYVKRILRKATGLYEEMEDTLYRMYSIEAVLYARDEAARIKRMIHKFVRYVTYSIVTVDDKGFEWKAVTNKSGMATSLMKFDVKFKLNGPALERAMYKDGLILPTVFMHYLTALNKGQIKEANLESMRDYYNNHDDILSGVLEKGIGRLQTELENFEIKCDGNPDPLEVLLESYQEAGLDMKNAELIGALYHEVKELTSALL